MLAEDEQGTQGQGQGTQDMLASEHVSSQSTLARKHVSKAHSHVSL